MKVLMISTDRKIFEAGSAVRQRMVEYGGLCDELHIIIFAKKDLGLKDEKISGNVWAHPTNSANRWLYVWDAFSIGKNLPSRDVVTTQDPFETGVVGLLLSRKFKIPLNLQVHTDFLSPYFLQDSFLNKIRVLIAKFILKRADSIRVVSKKISDSIKNSRMKLRAVPTVIPIFTDIEKIEAASPKFDLHDKYSKFKYIILWVGRFEKEKNPSLALEIMKELTKNLAYACLVMVGDGSLLKELKEKAEKDYIDVYFEGWQEDTISYYKTSDVYLNTSFYEGYGLSIVEAVASGCPVISTDVGVVSEIVKDGESGFVCPPGDGACFADKILRVVKNQDLRDTIIENAKKALENGLKISKEEYLNKIKNNWEECVKMVKRASE
jgi:glycosyltransferase involved in cell wall biosynthesis